MPPTPGHNPHPQSPAEPSRWWLGRVAHGLLGDPNDTWSLKQYQWAMMMYMFLAHVGGFLVLLLRACVTAEWGGLPVAILWAGAASTLAALVGFLFAIPKVGDAEGPPLPPPPGGELPKAAGPRPTYSISRNMQDIADWLTKLIVGLSLVMFRDILAGFREMSDTLAKGLGGTPADVAVAQGVLMYYAGLGLFGGYVQTRLYLSAAFRRADDEVVRQLSKRVESVEGKVATVESKVR
jgi:hypothetical protein